MNKPNCWEFMKCGKGPSENGNSKSGSCPIATETSANDLNGGVNGGRICWIIAETCCNGEVKCSDLHRNSSCFSCEFRYKVTAEEGLLSVCKATGSFLENSGAIQQNVPMEQ
jgi:hypothetical protein